MQVRRRPSASPRRRSSASSTAGWTRTTPPKQSTRRALSSTRCAGPSPGSDHTHKGAIMRLSTHNRDIPTRVATGAYILHTGWEKWHGGEEQAKGVHGMAVGAYPFLGKIPAPTFLKLLAASE